MAKMEKQTKPQIIKKISKREIQESGCCFRSCGGAPVIQQYESIKNRFCNDTNKLLRKIK